MHCAWHPGGHGHCQLSDVHDKYHATLLAVNNHAVRYHLYTIQITEAELHNSVFSHNPSYLPSYICEMLWIVILFLSTIDISDCDLGRLQSLLKNFWVRLY